LRFGGEEEQRSQRGLEHAVARLAQQANNKESFEVRVVQEGFEFGFSAHGPDVVELCASLGNVSLGRPVPAFGWGAP